MRRVLVTGIYGPAGQALAGQLLDAGYELVGTDMACQSDDRMRVHKLPGANDPAMLGRLMDIVEREEIDLVIPTVSEELVQVGTVRHAFTAPVVLADGLGVARAEDKLFTMWHLAAHGVRIPRFATPDRFADADQAMEFFGGPFVIKPRVSRGGRGVVVVDSPSDVEDWAALDPGQILQRFAPAEEYAPVVFLDPDGTADRTWVLRKTGLKEGRVGNAIGVELVADGVDDVADLALETARALDLAGPCDIDVRRLADGTPVVLEVNARFGANSAAAPELLSAVLAADWSKLGRASEQSASSVGSPA